MKYIDAYHAMCTGKKVRRSCWYSDNYIHYVDCIRTNTGERIEQDEFDRSATDWEIFEEPVLETKATYADLYPAMIAGKKIRRKAWAPTFWIHIPLDSESRVTDNYGDPCNVSRWEMVLTDWEIVEEPEPVKVKPELTAADVEIHYTQGKIAGIKALRERYRNPDQTHGIGLKEAKDLFDALKPSLTQVYTGLSAYDWYLAAKGQFKTLEKDHPMLKLHLTGTLIYGDYLVWREQQ